MVKPIISYVASHIEPTAAEAARRRSGLQDTTVLHQVRKVQRGPGLKGVCRRTA